MQHHINCQTQKNSGSPLNKHLSTLAKIRGNTRDGYKPGDVDATGQKCVEKTMTHSSGSTLLCRHQITHTHKKYNVSEISNTREKMTTITTTTHSNKTTCKIAHDAVSPVPSSHQCTEPEPTETRTAQNNPKNHSKTQTKSKSQKQRILTTTPPATDLNTPQHRRLKQVDSLRCVIWRSCPPSEINE